MQSSREHLREVGVIYQFDGSGDMHGGVQDYINTLGRFVDEEAGIHKHVLVGSGVSATNVAQDVFTAFKSEVTIAGHSGFDITANGSQNLLAPTPSADVRSRIDMFGPDIIHSMHPWQPQHGNWINRKVGDEVARVGTYHIDSSDRLTNAATKLSGMISHLGKRSLGAFDAWVAVSPVAASHARQTGYFRGDREFEIVPNAVDVDAIAQARPFVADEIEAMHIPEASDYIVFVGRPDDRKGLGELLEAFKKLDNVYDSAMAPHLVICGGDKDSLLPYITQAIEHELRGKVSFLGSVSQQDKYRWLSTASLAVFPAKYGESQGIVLLEAMAAGAGVVLGGDNKGYAWTMGDQPSSDFTIFNPHDTAELAKRLSTVLTCQNFASQLHEEQQKLVRSKFDIAVVGRQMLDIYARILKS